MRLALPVIRTLSFSILMVCFASFSFAEQPENEIENTPDDMRFSGTLWLSDLRWEIDSPTSTFSWGSESLGITVQTSCDYRLRRSVEDAHAIVLFGCQGFSEDAIVWIFSDLGEVLWGIYDEGIIRAIQDTNYHFASSSAEIGPASKLIIWDGTFETDKLDDLSSNFRSWGRIKSSLLSHQ